MLMRRFPLRTLLLGLAALIVIALLAQALRQGLFEAHNEYVLTAARAGGVWVAGMTGGDWGRGWCVRNAERW